MAISISAAVAAAVSCSSPVTHAVQQRILSKVRRRRAVAAAPRAARRRRRRRAAVAPRGGATLKSKMAQPLRIVSLNVLAPELCFQLWRSSYGLPLLSSAAAYGATTRSRYIALAHALRALSPDVLLLQEVSDFRHPSLGHSTTADWFARALGLAVAQVSFKGAPISWNLPPHEQRREGPAQAAAEAGMRLPGSGGPGVVRADSGVATLYNPAALRHEGSLGNAEAHGASAEFKTGWGSPWTLDAFSLAGGGGGGGGDYALPPPVLRVLNVHIETTSPHILRSLCEVFSRAGKSLGAAPELAPWDHVVVGGGFNAGEKDAADEFRLFFTGGGAAASQLREVPQPGGGSGARAPLDRFLVGPGVSVCGGGECVVGDEPLLTINTQPPGVKAFDARAWGRGDTPYVVHGANEALLARGGAGSDHSTLLVSVALRPLEKKGGGSLRGGPRGSPPPQEPQQAPPAAPTVVLVGPRGAKVEMAFF